jgi:hypothetical protein
MVRVRRRRKVVERDQVERKDVTRSSSEEVGVGVGRREAGMGVEGIVKVTVDIVGWWMVDE